MCLLTSIELLWDLEINSDISITIFTKLHIVKSLCFELMKKLFSSVQLLSCV